jgi:hypothetical protein
MKVDEEHLLIFERHFFPEKRCRPPLGWGIMPSACFSAPLTRGLVEGASAGQHVAAGAAWVDLPQANPSGRAERSSSAGMHDEACEAVRRTRASGEAEAKRASQYPQRPRPSEQPHNDERREPRRSLQTKPPGGGAEKPSKGGIPKGRHCFEGAKRRSSSPEDEPNTREGVRKRAMQSLPEGCHSFPGGKWHQPVGRRRGKNRQMASASGCGDPGQRPQSPLASWRGTVASCVGLALCLPGRCFAFDSGSPEPLASYRGCYAVLSAPASR